MPRRNSIYNYASLGIFTKQVWHAVTRRPSCLVYCESSLWCWGVQRGPVKFKCSMYLTISGQSRIQAGGADKVEGDNGLGY